MDTLYALSSGSVPSGIAVIRVSGPGAAAAIKALCGDLPYPRHATLRSLVRPRDGAVIDRGLVLWFPAPRSFTGEDLAEFHLHGGRAVIGALFDALGELGARPAEAGEFSRRALLNGKLDLTAAEGIADLIAAETEVQRRQAVTQAGGMLARRAETWREILIGLRAQVEARLDFSDEADVPDRLPADFFARVGAVRVEMRDALASAASGERLRLGLRVVILGAPNAGKSSLLNALAGRDIAIVTEEAGTTRDVLEAHLDLGGYPVVVSDTAGLREAESAAEREGVRRARAAAGGADLVIWLDDGTGAGREPASIEAGRLMRVRSKVDVLRPEENVLGVSAVTGEGLSELVEMIRAAAVRTLGEGNAMVTRERQRTAISAALRVLDEARGASDEIVADLLRAATDAIGRLSGRVAVEEVLDQVFAEFCIGK